MRTLSIAVGVLALICSPAQAGRGLVYARFALVRAQCGQIGFGPCSPAFDFKRGVVELSGAREPTPTCPKTHQPSEAKAGTVKVTGLTKNGAPFTGTLTTETDLITTFGKSDTSACELKDTSTGVLPSLVGDVTCKNGKCRGTLIPIICLPPQCADVAITTQFAAFYLNDDANPPEVIATPGTVIMPKR
jgi:hypothetical protein